VRHGSILLDPGKAKESTLLVSGEKRDQKARAQQATEVNRKARKGKREARGRWSPPHPLPSDLPPRLVRVVPLPHHTVLAACERDEHDGVPLLQLPLFVPDEFPLGFRDRVPGTGKEVALSQPPVIDLWQTVVSSRLEEGELVELVVLPDVVLAVPVRGPPHGADPCPERILQRSIPHLDLCEMVVPSMVRLCRDQIDLFKVPGLPAPCVLDLLPDEEEVIVVPVMEHGVRVPRKLEIPDVHQACRGREEEFRIDTDVNLLSSHHESLLLHPLDQSQQGGGGGF
ncbi:hypothetical protein IE53DRAFT_403387, partial [Violaceomyces palustris]